MSNFSMAGGKNEGGDGVPLWERLAKANRRAQLSHSRIALAAIEIADTAGLEAVTIRNLAKQLDASPMALYRYVTSKDDIFDLMVDACYAEFSLERGSGKWREVLSIYAKQLREALLRHPWHMLLPGRARLALTPNRFAVIEHVLAALDIFGLDLDSAMLIFEIVTDYANGMASAQNLRSELVMRSGIHAPSELRDVLAPQMRWLLDTKAYPTYERYVRGAERKDDEQWRFDTGLGSILEGIAYRFQI